MKLKKKINKSINKSFAVQIINLWIIDFRDVFVTIRIKADNAYKYINEP